MGSQEPWKLVDLHQVLQLRANYRRWPVFLYCAGAVGFHGPARLKIRRGLLAAGAAVPAPETSTPNSRMGEISSLPVKQGSAVCN